MKSVLMSALVIFSSVGFATAQNNNDTYTNPTLGISLTKPAEWHFMSAEQNQENLRRTKLNDEEFQKLMLKYATAPLVVMTKYQEPYDDLNPSLKVNIKPLGGLPGDNPGLIMGLILPSLEKVFEDYSVEEGPTDTLVSGLRASYVRVYYTMRVSDTTGFPTCSELWIVPKGSFFFMIGAGTRQDEKTGTREEIAEILASLKLDTDKLKESIPK